MKKTFRRIGIILLIIVGVIVTSAVIIAAAFRNQVGRRLLTEINKQLATELIVENFDLSILGSFPNVSANLNKVILRDNRGGGLLEADQISFKMGLLGLFRSKVDIKSVVLKDGALQLAVDKKGNPNYDILKKNEPTEAPSGNSDFNISLELATLQNIDVIYIDEKAGQETRLLVEHADFAGQFNAKKFSLNSKAKLLCMFVDMDGVRYLPGKELSYDAKILVDLENAVYSFEDVKLGIETNVFDLKGTITHEKAAYLFALEMTNDQGDLSGVLQLLPEQTLAYIGDFKSSGNFNFQATVRGPFQKDLIPEVSLQLHMQEGKLTSPRMSGGLKDVAFDAKADYGGRKPSKFQISKFKGYFNRELIEGELYLDNFENPEIDLYLDGVIPMKSIYGLFNDNRITDGAGELEVKNLRLNGKYSDFMQTSSVDRVRAGGEIEFDDAGLTINGESIFFDKGKILFSNKSLNIDQLTLNGAGSDLVFNGSAFNFLPVVFADSLNSQNAELEFKAELFSKTLDLTRLMGLSDVALAEKQNADSLVIDSLKTVQIQNRQKLVNFLRGSFSANIEKFVYRKMEGQDFKGRLDFANSEMVIEGDVRGMGGAFNVQGNLYFEDQPRLRARITGGGIDTKQFFGQCENFYQEVLRSEHVQGTMNAKIAISAFWDEVGNFDYDKLRVVAGIEIEDGELMNFEMLENFSTFVKIKDLQNIKFAKLQNFLEVRKQRIYIPVMFIQSNAMNLSINGDHSFENDFRYNVKVNAGQVLSTRFKKYDPTLQPQPARESGFFNLYYTIFGNLQDYKFKAAKRQVKSDFELSEHRKHEIQQALLQEFGQVMEIAEPETWNDEKENNFSEKEELLDEIVGGQSKKN